MKKLLALILLFSCFLSACGKPAAYLPTTAKESEVSTSSEKGDSKESNSSTSSVITFAKESEEVVDWPPTDRPFSFNFVDVFGEEYETEIKVGFPKTDYSKDKFFFNGEVTSYEDEVYYTRFGIDVSNKQKLIDWTKVKESGVTFAIIRLGYRGYGSYGDINIDKQFHNNIKAAQDQGIDVGVYFFAQAVNEEEALEEADFVIANLEGYDLQLPVVYDPESILDDTARTDNVSGEQFTKNAIVFCQKIEEAGYEPMIYSNMLWEAYQFDMEKLTDYPFWYADYEKLPQTPYAFTMWQYTEKGHVDGINTIVDLDVQFIKKEE